jgi:hypothetical protein
MSVPRATYTQPTRRLDPAVPNAPRICITIDPPLLDQVDTSAEEWAMSRSAAMRRVLEAGFKSLGIAS